MVPLFPFSVCHHLDHQHSAKLHDQLQPLQDPAILHPSTPYHSILLTANMGLPYLEQHLHPLPRRQCYHSTHRQHSGLFFHSQLVRGSYRHENYIRQLHPQKSKEVCHVDIRPVYLQEEEGQERASEYFSIGGVLVVGLAICISGRCMEFTSFWGHE